MKKITLKELMKNVIHHDFMIIANDKENYNEELADELAELCCQIAKFYNKYSEEYQFDVYKDIALFNHLGQGGIAFSRNKYLSEIAWCIFDSELIWEDENE